MAFVGISNIIIRGIVLERLIDKHEERSLLTWGMISISLAYIILSMVNIPWLFYICILFFAFGGGITRPLILGEISRNVSDNKQGAMMGAINSIGSISQIITPLIGGYILNYHNAGFLPLASLIVFFIGISKSRFFAK